MNIKDLKCPVCGEQVDYWDYAPIDMYEAGRIPTDNVIFIIGNDGTITLEIEWNCSTCHHYGAQLYSLKPITGRYTVIRDDDGTKEDNDENLAKCDI